MHCVLEDITKHGDHPGGHIIGGIYFLILQMRGQFREEDTQ